jgi:hypothetical protein
MKTPVNSVTLSSQGIDLKEKTENTGADHARKTHRPEKYIRTLRRTRDRAGTKVNVGVAGSKYGPT